MHLECMQILLYSALLSIAINAKNVQTTSMVTQKAKDDATLITSFEERTVSPLRRGIHWALNWSHHTKQ